MEKVNAVESARVLEITRSWLAILNAFLTLSCILLFLHAWNICGTFILLI
jgi:hypothetical protein